MVTEVNSKNQFTERNFKRNEMLADYFFGLSKMRYRCIVASVHGGGDGDGKLCMYSFCYYCSSVFLPMLVIIY